MSASQDPRLNSLSLEQLTLIDERCDLFEREWRVARDVRIEDYLVSVDPEVLGPLWLELSITDHELRDRAGERTTLDRYLPSCPDRRVLLEISTDFALPKADLTRGATPATIDHVRAAAVKARPPAAWIPAAQAVAPKLVGPPSLDSTVGEADAATAPLGLRSTQAANGDSHPQDAAPTLERGATLGDYELLEVIAQGGMGVVYKARQTRLNRIVAIKTIRAGLSANEREIRFFRREAEAVAALDHPHIVPIFEVGEWRGLLFHSMKLVVGRNLQEDLGSLRGKPRSIAKLVSIVARAIHHAHRRGVLHRDLKPSNILIDDAGLPHVIDFGLARRVGVDGESQLSDSVVGTLNYMSPEQARGVREEVTTATDVYGLGAILYALLSGRAPHAASSVVDLVRQMLDYEPARPRDHVPDVDPDLEIICLKCINKEPGRRYASAGDLADDLERWLDGRPIVARPASVAERVVKYVRRRRALSAMVGLVAAAVAAGSGGVVWQWREAVAARGDLQIAVGVAQKNEAVALMSEDHALHLAYAAKINLAERDWRDANVSALTRRLDETRPLVGKKDLRGFEWHYMNRLAGAANRTLARHDREVWSVRYSKDGKLLATAGQDGAVKIWDPSGGRLIRTLKHAQPVNAVAFDPGGGRLAAGGDGGELTLWDVASGQVARVFKGHAKTIHSVDVSPDSKLLASSSGDGSIRIWDLETGRSLYVIEDHRPRRGVGITFSPDGKVIGAAGGEARGLRLWDAGTGRSAKVLKDDQGAPIALFAFHPDGKTIATTGEDGSIKLWDLANNAPSRVIYDAHNREMIRGVIFSPDGKFLACTRLSGQALELWDVASGSLIRIFRGHSRSLTDLAFSPDGLHVATASNDATVRIWDRDREQDVQSLTEPETANDVAFGPEGAFVITAGRDKNLRLWDRASGRLVRVFQGHTDKVRVVVLSPDGRLAASAGDDQTARIWEVATGKPLRALKGHTAPIYALAFQGDGLTLATGSDDHSIRLWDVATGESTKTLAGHPGQVNFIGFLPGGKTLVSGGGESDGFVMTWNVESGRRDHVFLAEADGIYAMALSPDGRQLATSGYDRTITIWDRESQKPVHRLKGHGLIAHRLKFSPDGRRLASAGVDRTIRIWDPVFGAELLVLRGHIRPVWSVAFSPNGRYLASTSDDRTVRIWDSGDEAGAAGPPHAP